MNLVPVPSDEQEATCPSCSAPLVGDQRYCLACGHPVSPVRLAFLDVLQSEYQPQSSQGLGPAGLGGVPITQVSQATAAQPSDVPAWLRRYSGLFGLLGVLLLAGIAGLLLGHWAGQGKAAPSRETIKLEGVGALAAAAPAATTAASSATPAPAASSNTKAEAQEAKQAAKEAKVTKTPPPKPVKVSSSGLKKLSTSTGTKHEEEVSKLGDQPIETGGGSSSSTPAPKESSGSPGAGSKVETIE